MSYLQWSLTLCNNMKHLIRKFILDLNLFESFQIIVLSYKALCPYRPPTQWTSLFHTNVCKKFAKCVKSCVKSVQISATSVQICSKCL